MIKVVHTSETKLKQNRNKTVFNSAKKASATKKQSLKQPRNVLAVFNQSQSVYSLLCLGAQTADKTVIG